ncbi:MAG: type II toxin-antitoxin system RelE/ParE family toxin [Butyrivibrio sp.]|nr:type II toxin-antitoxin system RelE/ParE family toxin [Butyrivibrio sp.]
MEYKVILSDIAKQQLDNILFYICITLCNETAAHNVLQDAENTIQKLAQSGSSLKICDEPELAKYGYRKIHFSSHRYIMLYIVMGKEIRIDRIYHELEDYQNLPD